MNQQQFVSTFEEACKVLGREAITPDVSNLPEHLRSHVTATIKLSAILEVNNGDWKADLGDTDQWKFFPVFRIEKKKGASGFGLSYTDDGCSFTHAFLGSRLACASSELAIFMGKNCAELYKDLLS